MPRFDWYQCTLDVDADELMARLCTELEMVSVRPCRAINSYHHGVELYRNAEERLLAIYWGGNPGTHLLCSGQRCDEVVPVLRYVAPQHRITRLDVAEDFEAPGLFDTVAESLKAFALAADLQMDQRGDWERGQARTLYIGAADSAVRLVVYEKGYEQGLGATRPHWVRIESRIRPQGPLARHTLASAAPLACLGASWLPRAFDALSWLDVPPITVTKPWRPRSVERARAALVLQYGKTLEQWSAEVGGWEALGAILQGAVEARAA